MQQDPVRTISSYINQHPLTVLSTLNADGTPHGTTIYTGSDGQLNVYFMTKSGTTKVRNIRENSAVALTMSSEDHQTTLQINGHAAEITMPDEGTIAFQVLGSIRHQSEDFRLPITKIEAGSYVIFKVEIVHATLTQYEETNRISGTAKIEYNR